MLPLFGFLWQRFEKKLELEKNGVHYIQTHIGIGYRMLRIEKNEQETNI